MFSIRCRLQASSRHASWGSPLVQSPSGRKWCLSVTAKGYPPPLRHPAATSPCLPPLRPPSSEPTNRSFCMAGEPQENRGKSPQPHPPLTTPTTGNLDAAKLTGPFDQKHYLRKNDLKSMLSKTTSLLRISYVLLVKPFFPRSSEGSKALHIAIRNSQGILSRIV